MFHQTTLHRVNLNFKLYFDILHRRNISVQIIILGDEMGDNDDRDQSAEKNNEAKVSVQKSWLKREEKEDNHSSVTGRPNIDVISKRNEEAAKQERKSLYTVIGIILLLTTGILLLVYFFSYIFFF